MPSVQIKVEVKKKYANEWNELSAPKNYFFTNIKASLHYLKTYAHLFMFNLQKNCKEISYIAQVTIKQNNSNNF